jgi:hypothetical protein
MTHGQCTHSQTFKDVKLSSQPPLWSSDKIRRRELGPQMKKRNLNVSFMLLHCEDAKLKEGELKQAGFKEAELGP